MSTPTDTVAADVIEESEERDSAHLRLPFSFAKRHGVVLVWDLERPVVYFTVSPSPHIFSEIVRLAGQSPVYRNVSSDQLAEVLSQCYHNDSSEALQDAAGIGDDMDLSSLAEAVPVTEDLLEQSDDAPVIRLINALLTEAIKGRCIRCSH